MNHIILEPTPEHEVWIRRDGITFWCEAKDILVGDELLSEDLKFVTVTDVEPIHYPEGVEESIFCRTTIDA